MYLWLSINGWATTGDSLQYIRANDTLFIEMGMYDEKILIHEVAEKQTLYSIARFYGMEVQELFYYNPELQTQVVKIGQPVRIPIPLKALLFRTPKAEDSLSFAPVCYRIRRGDNLFRISKYWFGVPIDTLMMRNQLTKLNVSTGQVLHLGWVSTDGVDEKYRKFRGSPEWKKSQMLRRSFIRDAQVKNEKYQNGVAFWQKDGGKQRDLYVLHREAPIGSIVAITNPMSRKIVFAKVIDRLPDNLYAPDVLVVVSSKVAEMLGARDPRFYVELKYCRR